jgi:hypothetical protein
MDRPFPEPAGGISKSELDRLLIQSAQQLQRLAKQRGVDLSGIFQSPVPVAVSPTQSPEAVEKPVPSPVPAPEEKGAKETIVFQPSAPIINVPEQPAPQITVNVPLQAPPNIYVNVPEQQAPVIYNTPPTQSAPNVTVSTPALVAEKPKKFTVTRDGQGKISGIEEE